MLNLYVAYTTVIMLLGTFPITIRFRFFKYFWPVRVYISYLVKNYLFNNILLLIQLFIFHGLSNFISVGSVRPLVLEFP